MHDKQSENTVILLRNLEPPKLCNSTRLVINKIFKSLIDATIITGIFKNEREFIPKIPLISSSNFHYEFKRLQFTLKLCYIMTINKSQGHTLKVVGLEYLDTLLLDISTI